jgi:hypothetical protein
MIVLLTSDDIKFIFEDLVDFFPSEYTALKRLQEGKRNFPQVVVNLLEDKEIYYRGVGNFLDAENSVQGYMTLNHIVLDIYTKDTDDDSFYTSGNKSGDVEAREKIQELRERISTNWQASMDGTILQPIIVNKLSGIFTAKREHRYQLIVKLITPVTWTKTDETVYASYFGCILKEDTTEYVEYIDTRVIEE